MSDVGRVVRAIGLMDIWLDNMRGPGGYGGPVVHWWRDSLIFCGPGLDWRYEGIIAAYLTLFDRTGQTQFLDKARRAGNDIVGGQLADGTLRNSSFERNPVSGGTPHEAAADIGLLLLARTLRTLSEPDWERYLRVAEDNIRRVLVGRLWSEDQLLFTDGGAWFVPNKAATIIEALCLLAELTGREEYILRYVVPTADAILKHQVFAAGDRLDGAIAQASVGGRRVEQYFPYYAARTISGLCAAYRAAGGERYLEAATSAANFLVRCREEDGGSPQVLYPGGRINRYPRWIAGAGDILRALEVVRSHGFSVDTKPTLGWIMAGQLPSGTFKAAHGFRSQISQRPPRGSPDVRDVLPVVGWNDKAFRALAGLVENVPGSYTPSPVELDCSWRGEAVAYREDEAGVVVMAGESRLYSWHKGDSWAAWD